MLAVCFAVVVVVVCFCHSTHNNSNNGKFINGLGVVVPNRCRFLLCREEGPLSLLCLRHGGQVTCLRMRSLDQNFEAEN